MTVTTQCEECTATVGGRLLMSMELSRRQWKLGFTTGVGQRPRRRTLSTDAWDRVREEIAAPRGGFGSPPTRRLSAVTRRAGMGFGSTDISRAWGSRIWWWTPRASK